MVIHLIHSDPTLVLSNCKQKSKVYFFYTVLTDAHTGRAKDNQVSPHLHLNKNK